MIVIFLRVLQIYIGKKQVFVKVKSLGVWNKEDALVCYERFLWTERFSLDMEPINCVRPEVWDVFDLA